ncbi:M48 family metallopeptidase [Agitococcus lubricus]|uniref:Peptidase M48-like protein n=1 Tax=Agitococcus lubricus TaxID=1077255 RepID=A0A2T5J379_9GAMM|nr:M48 family metallopeptidase [Agitococcus lubricus]PTQ91036.1 peptidase M48-like protein [Agitococcus lubricus]
MRYSNPHLPASEYTANNKHELREMFKLLVIAILIIAGVVFLIDRLVYLFSPYIPFSWESTLVENIPLINKNIEQKHTDIKALKQEKMLQKRVDIIASNMNLPKDMKITAHYLEGATVNAFATLGGHVFVYHGMLEKIKYQEELDALLAHEIAHVYKRHITQQMSRAILISVILTTAKLNHSGFGRWLLGDGSNIGLLAYSRVAEQESDENACHISLKLHGHTQGVVKLMQQLNLVAQQQGYEWTKSHPDTKSRILFAQQYRLGEQKLKPMKLLF